MKTKFYIVIVLILSVSFAQAQSSTTNPEDETITVLTANDSDSAPTISNDLISPAELKADIARTNSDIRVYFNRVQMKRVENIKLLFPKIHKAEKA